MFKKVVVFLIVVFIMSAFSINSFANKTTEDGGTWKEKAEKKLEDIMKSKDTESTEQFLVEITKPERHGLFYQREKEATLAWLVKKDYISVNVLVYDEEANCYVKYEDPDDPDFGSWDITPDSIKFFTKTFKINKDSLKIRLVAYVKSELKDLKPGKNLQISNFTFNLFKESTKVNGFIKYQNMVDGIK